MANERRTLNNCRAFDSFAPAHSASGPPVYIARLPPALFCETPRCLAQTLRMVISLLHRLLHRVRIIEQDPFDYRDWQTAVLDQVIVELTKPKIVALSIFVT